MTTQKAKTANETLWGIHCFYEMEPLFLEKNTIAVGWSELGDLSKTEATKAAIKELVAGAYPQKKPAGIANWAGQVYRFVHEMKIGDLVVFSAKSDRQVHIGRIEGPYTFAPRLSENSPHTRKVKWIRAVPRTNFSQGALYELGSALTLFQLKNYADEFRGAAEGKVHAPPVDEDPTVVAVQHDVEETTRDFILKTLAQETKGHPFAHFVAHLLNAMGYRTRLAAEGPDGGVDIIAHRDALGFEPPLIKVQVKSSDGGNIGDPVVSSLYGKISNDEYGLFVTLGGFTPKARTFAQSKSNLRLVNGEELVKLILEHYERFDAKYKSLLPLRRVYIPVPVDEPA